MGGGEGGVGGDMVVIVPDEAGAPDGEIGEERQHDQGENLEPEPGSGGGAMGRGRGGARRRNILRRSVHGGLSRHSVNYSINLSGVKQQPCVGSS